MPDALTKRITRTALVYGAVGTMLTTPLWATGGIRSFRTLFGAERDKLPGNGRLPSLDGAERWLNSRPLSPETLRGRVTLVNFWTYTCVNWIRTLPYIWAWATKYAGAGLTVIGVHTPEFGFEHDIENITAAMQRFGVTYPVAVDNDYAIWTAFANHYWPATYLVDAAGNLRYHHFGEGEYAATEPAIQGLLAEAGSNGIDGELVTVGPRGLEVAADWGSLASPETYLGSRQATGFVQANVARGDEPTEFTMPGLLDLNTWSLAGNWTFGRHAAVLNAPGGRLAVQFQARDLNLVMGPPSRGASVAFQVFLDGMPAMGAPGADVDAEGQGVADGQRTYQLIRQSGEVVPRRFEIAFEDAGMEVYCLTFG